MWASVTTNIQFFVSRDDTGLQAALHVCSYWFQFNNVLKYNQIFFLTKILNVFGALWTYWFIDAFEKMVLAHTFSAWYWTFDKTNIPFFTVTTAVVNTTKYIYIFQLLLLMHRILIKLIMHSLNVGITLAQLLLDPL